MRDLDEREIIVLEEFTEGSDLLENYSTVVQNSDKKFIVVDNKHKKEELKDLLISQRQVCLPPYEPKDSVEYRYEEFSIFDIKMWLEEKGYHINFCERGSIHQPHLEWRKKNKFSFQDFIRKFAREKLHINDTNVYIDLPFEWGYHKNIKANISFERYPRTNHHELSKKVFLELCDKFEREGVEKKGSYNDVKDWNKIQDYIFNQTGEKTHRSRKKKWFGLFYEKLEIWLLRKAIKSIINSRNNESNK